MIERYTLECTLYIYKMYYTHRLLKVFTSPECYLHILK